jgi:hypothetical protein
LPEGHVWSITKEWKRAVLMLPLAFVTMCGVPVNLEEIERLLHVMNETKVEFTIPDENNSGDGHRTAIEAVQSEEAPTPGREKASASNS